MHQQRRVELALKARDEPKAGAAAACLPIDDLVDNEMVDGDALLSEGGEQARALSHREARGDADHHEVWCQERAGAEEMRRRVAKARCDSAEMRQREI